MVRPNIRHEEDPDHPGWWTWEILDGPNYNHGLGKFLVRREGPGHARCMIFPEPVQRNVGGMVHGGALMTFVDIAMFVGARVSDARLDAAVTLDLTTQFIAAGRIGVPLVTTVEILRETGRLLFLRGLVEQEGESVAAWSGTLRKVTRRP